MCLPNGNWASHPNVDGSDVIGWTNYTACEYNGTGITGSDSDKVPNIFIVSNNTFLLITIHRIDIPCYV